MYIFLLHMAFLMSHIDQKAMWIGVSFLDIPMWVIETVGVVRHMAFLLLELWVSRVQRKVPHLLLPK